MEEFYVGQIFENEYPQEAAIWCNDSERAYISEIEPKEDGTKLFQIMEDAPFVETLEQAKQRLEEYVQFVLDKKAKQNGYKDMATACSYYGSTVEEWARDADYFIKLRDSVWTECFQKFDAFQSAEDAPENEEEFIKSLTSFS